MSQPSPDQYPLEWTPELLWQRGVEAVEPAYFDVYKYMFPFEQVDEDTVHTKPYCDFWATAALKRVKTEIGRFDSDAKVKKMEWVPEPAEEPLVRVQFHSFIEVTLEDNTPRIMDGTWQQFLRPHQRNAHLPRMLAGTPDEIMTIAVDAGFPDTLLHMWNVAKKARF